jgi:hypothetical protein
MIWVRLLISWFKRGRPLGYYNHFFSVALQSLKDLGRLTYRRFLELFRHTVGLLGRVISPWQGLYLHRTTQHRKTRANINALSGIRTHDLSNQPAKTHASDRTATMTGRLLQSLLKIISGNCNKGPRTWRILWHDLRNRKLPWCFVWMCETLSLVPRNQYRMRCPETKYWGEHLNLRKRKDWENFITRSSIICD